MNEIRKERTLFVTIIIVSIIFGVVVGIKFKPSNTNNTMSQEINLNTKSDYEKLNINTATQKELELLPSINEIKSKKIIEYREENGEFDSVYELINVEGIGEKTIENIKDKAVTK